MKLSLEMGRENIAHQIFLIYNPEFNRLMTYKFVFIEETHTGNNEETLFL